MKNILVLTDLWENAAHAAESAAWLADQLHAGLVLRHCEPKIAVMPGYVDRVMVARAMVGPGEVSLNSRLKKAYWNFSRSKCPSCKTCCRIILSG